MAVLSYMLLVALATIQNRGWGTRAPSSGGGADADAQAPALPKPAPAA
jgi:hypothetical protein